jgi:hypothetical protein
LDHPAQHGQGRVIQGRQLGIQRQKHRHPGGHDEIEDDEENSLYWSICEARPAAENCVHSRAPVAGWFDTDPGAT